MKNGIKVDCSFISNKTYLIAYDMAELWTSTGKIGYNIHRLDGPAIIYNDGDMGWYINDNLYTSWKRFGEVAKLSEEQLSILVLKYGSML